MKTVFQGLMMSAAPEVDAVALRGGKSTVSIQGPLDALMQSTFMEHQGEVNPDEIQMEFDQDISAEIEVTGEGPFDTVVIRRTDRLSDGTSSQLLVETYSNGGQTEHKGIFYRWGKEEQVNGIGGTQQGKGIGELFWNKGDGDKQVLCGIHRCHQTKGDEACEHESAAMRVLNTMNLNQGIQNCKFSWESPEHLTIVVQAGDMNAEVKFDVTTCKLVDEDDLAQRLAHVASCHPGLNKAAKAKAGQIEEAKAGEIEELD